ncbi:MAG: transporter associated domain-containing protein [Burkholderiaceae bacterium]
MPDPSQRSEDMRPLIERLKSLLNRVPDDRSQLLGVLRKAHERDLIDADAVSMIEGVLQVSELSARDIMVPRSQVDVIDITQPFEQFLEHVITTAHSRFPVVEGDRDNVLGILHAKELLRLVADADTDVRDLLRPPVFVPESKALNVLLRDFRANRNHLAIVVDEYGGVAGLVTIEDVLEQIVGDIEDEFDFDEESDHIIAVERILGDQRYRVRAITEIAQFNHVLGTQLADDDFDTIGGLVTEKLGRVPRRGETVEFAGLRFEVLRADARQVQLLLVTRIGNGDATPEGATS